MKFVCLNGTMLPASEPVLLPGNRSFRYGDGIFETIRMVDGRMPLASLHFERLFKSLRLLKIGSSFFEYQLSEWIIELCQLNGCLQGARVRLTLFRDNAGAGFLIEAEPLDPAYTTWNETGWQIGIYPDARKSIDALSNLKSANYLPYVMADLFARENNLDEALVLNSANSIADASKANIFIIRNGALYTPALHQGCVDGVMRRWLIDRLKSKGFAVYQEAVSEAELLAADEVFLTNALYGLRWVKQYGNKVYGHSLSRRIYDEVIATI